MTCTVCNKDLSLCQCSNILDKLKILINHPHVYIGNIIENRIQHGLNTWQDFEGINVYNPFTKETAPRPRE